MKFKIKSRFLLAALFSFLWQPEGIAQANAPSATLTPIPLTDLSAFKPVTNNWKQAKDVFFDPMKGGNGKITAGTGILVNTLGKSNNGHLFTTMEHGDIELELDFMMAKGSNAGVYLQGRYEVQMFDSWGETDPKYSDAGAIYQRWDEKRGSGREGYEGHPPLVNVSKAPGLWQHYKIVFRAPRFNAQGQKIENARFLEVYQNGVLVQKNIEVTGPTRAAAFEDEKPLGPLMIQGDHGAVAIRNIKYQAYGTEEVKLIDLKLTSYDNIKALSDFNTNAPKSEMDIDVLAHLAPATRDQFAGKITGTIQVPTSGDYNFNLNLAWIPMDTNPNYINGAGELTIGDKKVLTVTGKTGVASGTVNLAAGTYPLNLAYFKSSSYWYARRNDITLTVSGPGVALTALKTPLKVMDPVGAITVKVADEPMMQRGFLEHLGKKRTHVISVGEPGGANYAIDLSRGQFLQVWRGDFLETTPMWYGRGETQLEVPMGSVTQFPAKPSLTFLADQNAAWPDSNAAYNNLGYDVSKAGRPIFKYNLGNANVRETVEPEDNGRKLTHTFTVTPGQETQAIWCRVAEGSTITKMPNGLYAIGDKEYFVQLDKKEKPVIRKTAQNTEEMLLPVKAKDASGVVKYAIVW
ncbi:DUF1080 domain-containing protein [Adhaeribacter swui]|uniref:DUF1080 domain-containing protein n=1 Tax=Adhaeribacter swui TaxID=2086471 RepID=A0A7G7G7T0_9BACT|nr:DUF1080 domain-containing protein [Adhaeribacter swui]QNF33214.1 DUF1080 domain-containing protein [Adhaeribacter swui]